MKIGLYGGTFDPPHYAHLKLADWVREHLQLACIYFIPTSVHAFKKSSDITPVSIRLHLLESAIDNDDRFKISRIEVERQNVSYTVDTLRKFEEYENLPESELYYILGADNLADFHRWKEPEAILKLARVVAIRRKGRFNKQILDQYKNDITFLKSPVINISSTEIRKKISRGEDVSDQIPSSVWTFIKEHNLYRSADYR
jgi:nicotinate-nucleotide adenylyltransferase